MAQSISPSPPIVVTQGTASGLAGAWPVEVTDGTSVLGTPAHPLKVDPVNLTPQMVMVANLPRVQPVALSGPLPPGTANLGDTGFVRSASATQPQLVTVGTTAVPLLGTNLARRRLMLQNTGTTTLYLTFGLSAPTATVYHHALAGCGAANDGTGGTLWDETWTGPVQAIGSGGGGTVVVSELF